MKINAAFCRYAGEPLSLYAAVLSASNGRQVMTIAKKGRHSTRKESGMLLIVDAATQENFDMLFTSERFLDGLNAYHDVLNSQSLVIDESLMQYKPDNSIEMDGLNQNGSINYRFNEVNNGQAAVLAICLYFRELTGFIKSIDSMSQWEQCFMTI
ncbi:hypothetical protein [Hydromonas duriensis]|uniref:Uncharacterized protein n=1 Tax=Hydromonas duriensis TaxID=1527608 RepID=A0A4R6Y723_9BURK|nr:hypothetical protein [Hydromonas duriensis]TDR30686.1 hypothetical protein DFR44_11836 [Hydromonas duriensis]